MATGRVPTTANSPLTAKGDLFTYSTAPARLAVGSNGDTIVADSSTSTGLRYQVPVNVNPVLNSAFQIWQRGTTITNSLGGYGPDRWSAYRSSAGATTTRQLTSDTTNLPFIQYCARVQRDSGNSAIDGIYLYQSFETVNSIPFIGKTVTLSFYARKGANYSATSSGLAVALNTGTGTDQNWAAYTGASTAISQTATLTTTWQRFSYTSASAIATTVNELAVSFGLIGVGTAGANDYFEVTGVQLEVGSVATPFKTYAGTLQGELAACQRYYYRNTAPTATALGYAIGRTTTQADIVLTFPVTMRTNPSAVETGGTFDFTNPNVGAFTITSFTFVHCSYQTGFIKGNTASGLAQGITYELGIPTSGFVGFSAEL